MNKEITINDIALHAKSKKEVYDVLTIEGGIYLPPIIDANRKYVQNIIRGYKKFLYSKSIKVAKVPHIDKLSIKNLLKWGKDNTEIEMYLPTYDYDKFPNREWLCNVLNTLNYEGFQQLIKTSLKEREKMIVMKKRMNVVAIPEIIDIFAKSQNVSISKGKSHYLMRDFKSGIKRKNPEEEMKVDEKWDRNVEKLQTEIIFLKEKINEYEHNQNDLLNDRGKLVKLYQEGIIDSDGDFIEK